MKNASKTIIRKDNYILQIFQFRLAPAPGPLNILTKLANYEVMISSLRVAKYQKHAT